MIHTVISCDKCGKQLAYIGALPEKLIIKFSRGHGWSCGKQHLCADCRKKKKEIHHDHN